MSGVYGALEAVNFFIGTKKHSTEIRMTIRNRCIVIIFQWWIEYFWHCEYTPGFSYLTDYPAMSFVLFSWVEGEFP